MKDIVPQNRSCSSVGTNSTTQISESSINEKSNNPLLLASLDPDVLAELGGHAHQECLTLGSDSFMKVVTPTGDDLQVHR